jgi:oxalate---CoA ligase
MPHQSLVRISSPVATAETIAEVIARHALQCPHRPAIVASGFAPLSYRQLASKIAEIGDCLRAAGIGASSRVAIVLPKGPEAAILGVAIAAHAIGFPIDPALSAAQVEQELTKVQVDAVVLPGWMPSEASHAALALGLGIFHATAAADALSAISLSQVRPVRTDRQRSGDASSSSVAIIQSSSGTTGAAKLILITHVNLLDMARKMQDWYCLSPDDRCACILPLHSGFGFKVTLMAPLLIGGSVAITRTVKAEDIAEWMSELRPTWLVANPTFLRAVLDHLQARLAGKLEHCLRFVASGNSYLPEPLRAGLEATLGVPALQSYGLVEAGIVASNPAPPAMRKAGTAGVIWPEDVGIRAPDGQLLPSGQVGEVVLRGRGLSPGYIYDLEIGCDTVPMTAGFRADWLSTGDLGVVDADGYLTIVGRTKEIINRGGEKISPYEVEKALLLHPSVRETAAFGVPHPRLGENVSAAVVLHAGLDAKPSELRSFLFDHLAPSKVPQHVFVMDALPRGSTGKISRAQLSETIANRVRRIAPPRNILESQALEIWQRLIGRTDIGVDDNFFEAGGDSLLATQMLLEFESLVQRSLPQSELREAYTIRQLAAAVMRTLPSTSHLVTCAKRGNGTPLFFCDLSFSSRGFYSFRLADLLGPDQPVYLVHPARDLKVSAETTIEKMAEIYLPHMLAADAGESVQLAGYCVGGMLAWELAHRLRKAGRKVERVILIDTISFNARRPVRAANRALGLMARGVPAKARTNIQPGGMRSVWRGVNKLDSFDRHILGRAKRRIHRKLDQWRLGASRPRSSGSLGIDYWDAMVKYFPPPLDSAVSCLVCEKNWGTFKFSPKPWAHLARELDFEQVPGDHLSCISTHIRELVAVLQRLLSTSRKRTPVLENTKSA